MNTYKKLSKQIFIYKDYSIIPIRLNDRFKIRNWRNEQIEILRQDHYLTIKEQNEYFKNTVKKSFEVIEPNQLLFSFLFKKQLIGYGGLVHIDWTNRNSEISFLIDTKLNKTNFKEYWNIFLNLIEQVAFIQLNFKKIYTYAYDIRPNLTEILEQSNFRLEARLKNHHKIGLSYVDVLINSKFGIEVINANETHLNITYKWAKNKIVRKYSFSKNLITKESHQNWFFKKISSPNSFYFILNYNNLPVGSFRIDLDSHKVGVLSFLIDPKFHNKGLGRFVVSQSLEIAFNTIKLNTLIAFVMVENYNSNKIFQSLGFSMKIDQGICKYIFNNNDYK
jgi:RimJ/RimL family protein N-acetyltransferase